MTHIPVRIEDCALIGHCGSAALVGRDGSIDWMAMPRFDSQACFAALLGTEEHGRWLIAPAVPVTGVTRQYRPGTPVLETRFETAEGSVTLIDGMGRRESRCDVLRIVRGQRGRVPMRVEIVLRPGYGAVVPWVSRLADGRIAAVAGPDRFDPRHPRRMPRRAIHQGRGGGARRRRRDIPARQRLLRRHHLLPIQ